jgi:pilus assembly protein CpaC
MKNKNMVLYILTVLFILIFSSVSLAAIPVDVTVGKETILNLKEPSTRVSIADPDIVGLVLISPSEIIINGKKPGITSLIVWDNEGKPTFFDVIVYKERLVEFEKEKVDALTNKIKDIAPDSDIKVEMAGDTLVLNGTAKNRLVLDKIEKIAMLYGSKGCSGISRGCSLPAGCAQAGAQEITPGQGFVSVNVSQQAMQQAMQPAGEALCVLNLITMPEAQQVILEVKVAQIDKTKLKQMGISYFAKEKNYEFTAPGLFTAPSGSVNGLAQSIGSFDLSLLSPQIAVSHFPSGVAAVLQALQEKGLGKILAEPNLIVRSGEQGNFLVGKRIPIQSVYGVGAMATPSITYEEVGIRLNFSPEVLETGAIRLKINPAEVSSIARYIAFQGIVAPEIDTRTVNTSVDLREGESLILAGLLSEDMKENIQKVPILADIPILGALFRSTRKELDQTELAFFITPRLVKPFAPGVKPALPTDNRPTPEEEKDYEWIPLP